MFQDEIDAISHNIDRLGIYQRTTFLLLDRFRSIYSSITGLSTSRASISDVNRFLDEFKRDVDLWAELGSIMCLAHEDEIFEKLRVYLQRTDELTSKCDPSTITSPDQTVARLTIFREQSEAYSLFSVALHTRKDELIALRGADADAMMNLLHRKSNQFPHGDELRNLCWSRLLEIAITSQRLPSVLELKDISDTSLHPIGSGGFGDVYSGTWGSQRVAIKVTRVHGDREQVHKRLCREILIWSQLSHPHILQFLGITYGFPPYPAIVSPYMKNGDILSYIKLHPTVDVVELLRQVVSALAYLHGFTPTILHRDLRSPNILMDNNHKVVLTDFGISSITDQNVKSIMTTLQRGNVRWSSPELIFEDTAEPSCGSDIWAFGMVAVELLTKSIPYQNIVADGAVILHIHKGNRPVRPDGVDESLWVLISKCWHDTPAQRISALQLETEFNVFLQTRKALQKRSKVPPHANLRDRGIGKIYDVDYATIQIFMPRRLLEYIRNSDNKLLTKFEDTLGVSITLPETPISTTASDPNEEISVEVIGYPWCTEQVYLEFTKLLELERLASGVTWTSAVASEIRFEVKQEAGRLHSEQRAIMPRMDDRTVFSDGEPRARRQSRKPITVGAHEWPEPQPMGRTLSAPVKPATHAPSSVPPLLAPLPPPPVSLSIPPVPPIQPIAYPPSPVNQPTSSQHQSHSQTSSTYPPVDSAQSNQPSSLIPPYPILTAQQPAYYSTSSPYAQQPAPSSIVYAPQYGTYTQPYSPYIQPAGGYYGYYQPSFYGQPYDPYAQPPFIPPTVVIPPVSPPDSPYLGPSRYAERRHRRRSYRPERPTSPEYVPSVRSDSPDRGRQPNRINLPEGYHPWLDDNMELIQTKDHSSERTVSSRSPPRDNDGLRRRRRSSGYGYTPRPYSITPPRVPSPPRVITARRRSRSRSPGTVIVHVPSRSRSRTPSPSRYRRRRSHRRSYDDYDYNYRGSRAQPTVIVQAPPSVPAPPQPTVIVPGPPPRVSFNDTNQYYSYSNSSIGQPPTATTTTKKKTSFTERFAKLFGSKTGNKNIEANGDANIRT